MIQLKEYQEKALGDLRAYLEDARIKGAGRAYNDFQAEHHDGGSPKNFQPLEGLENIPYVCLRLPTGGGKTLLAAHTIRLAGEAYIEREYPLTLWLVPTNTIKEQTLDVLKDPDNANFKALSKAFNGRFSVFDIAEFRQIRPHDISGGACIVVSTFAALRVESTDSRKVYAHDENLEPHFSGIPDDLEEMERDERSRKVKYSFANLLHWFRPLVIIDEAHNAKSALSVEVLKRVNADCVIEYTATPAANSNVLLSVSAMELKAEEMIKLPIFFSEHVSWEQAVTASIQSRQRLEEIAREDDDYIRPVILYQAENKGKEITVEVLKDHLVGNEGVPADEIAIVTGKKKELEDINLFDPNCKIRHVITIQALREGWDCSFAYVLCSIATTRSSVTVEQILGRVLRMPYAKTRVRKELNRAYAHVSAQSWPHSVTSLRDHLINMGFEQQEIEEAVVSQGSLFDPADQSRETIKVSLTGAPDLSGLSDSEKSRIQVEEVAPDRFVMQVRDIDKPLAEKLPGVARNKKDKVEIAINVKLHARRRDPAPVQRGEVLSVPQLCLDLGDGPELAEKELFFGEDGLNLLKYYEPLGRDFFRLDETGKQYIVDLADSRVSIEIRHASYVEQLRLDVIHTDMDELGLSRWLDRRLRRPSIRQPVLLEFCRRAVRDLLTRDDMDLPKILRGKYPLERVLKGRIDLAAEKACKEGIYLRLLGPDGTGTIDVENHTFRFPQDYPANSCYAGRYGFKRHYYPRVGAMNGEEADCAFAIDGHPRVKFWARNLDRQPDHSFWLPTSTDRFYPDFVAVLDDGRNLVVEYKGRQFRDSDDTQEKENVGRVWAAASGNFFLMAWKKDGQGRDVSQQIEACLAQGAGGET